MNIELYAKAERETREVESCGGAIAAAADGEAGVTGIEAVLKQRNPNAGRDLSHLNEFWKNEAILSQCKIQNEKLKMSFTKYCASDCCVGVSGAEAKGKETKSESDWREKRSHNEAISGRKRTQRDNKKIFFGRVRSRLALWSVGRMAILKKISTGGRGDFLREIELSGEVFPFCGKLFWGASNSPSRNGNNFVFLLL